MKNFINSTKQRNYILIALIVSIISLTLPAFRALWSSESLFEDAYGSLMMFGLIFSGVIIFFREEFHALLSKKMEKNFGQDIVTFIALVPMIAVLWRLILLFIEANEIIGVSKQFQAWGGFFGHANYGISITYGFYLAFFGVLAAIICIFAFGSMEKVSEKISTKISEKNQEKSEATVVDSSQDAISEKSDHEAVVSEKKFSKNEENSEHMWREKISENETTENSSK